MRNDSVLKLLRTRDSSYQQRAADEKYISPTLHSTVDSKTPLHDRGYLEIREIPCRAHFLVLCIMPSLVAFNLHRTLFLISFLSGRAGRREKLERCHLATIAFNPFKYSTSERFLRDVKGSAYRLYMAFGPNGVSNLKTSVYFKNTTSAC